MLINCVYSHTANRQKKRRRGQRKEVTEEVTVPLPARPVTPPPEAAQTSNAPSKLPYISPYSIRIYNVLSSS